MGVSASAKKSGQNKEKIGNIWVTFVPVVLASTNTAVFTASQTWKQARHLFCCVLKSSAPLAIVTQFEGQFFFLMECNFEHLLNGFFYVKWILIDVIGTCYRTKQQGLIISIFRSSIGLRNEIRNKNISAGLMMMLQIASCAVQKINKLSNRVSSTICTEFSCRTHQLQMEASKKLENNLWRDFTSSKCAASLSKKGHEKAWQNAS